MTKTKAERKEEAFKDAVVLRNIITEDIWKEYERKCKEIDEAD